MYDVVFINCSRFPFIDWICSRQKLYETRSRDTLRALVGRRVYLAETGTGPRSVVRCSAVIDHAITCDAGAFRRLRPLHRVPAGSDFDWKPWTRKKVLYRLTDVRPVPVPFHPAEGVRHGRVWMEYNGKEVY